MEATFGMEGVLVLIRYFLERGSFVFSKFGVVSVIVLGKRKRLEFMSLMEKIIRVYVVIEVEERKEFEFM